MDQPQKSGIGAVFGGVVVCVLLMMAMLGGAKYASPAYASPGTSSWSTTSKILTGAGWLFAFGAALGLGELVKAVWKKIAGNK